MKKHIIKYTGWALTISILIITRLPYFTRTLENGIEPFTAMTAIVIFGITTSIVIYITFKDKIEQIKNIEKTHIPFLLISIPLIFLTLVYKLDTLSIQKEDTYQKNGILELDHDPTFRHNNYIFIQLDEPNKKVRFEVSWECYRSLNGGDTLNLTVGRGFLGVEQVLKFGHCK